MYRPREVSIDQKKKKKKNPQKQVDGVSILNEKKKSSKIQVITIRVVL